MALTLVIILGVFFETLSRIEWLKEKKDLNQSTTSEYIFFVIEVLFLIPMPNRFLTGPFSIQGYNGETVQLKIDSIFTVYMMYRGAYILKFLIHSELYYGSRPDRLSRLYTVKFGTFNAVKFLIN